jgi:dipeptidyl aminopeptidase/acylaminoacyl peptidase
VSVNGVSDLDRFLIDATKFNRRGMTAEWWRLSLGDDMKNLRRISPVDHVERVRSPVLLIHGEHDSVVTVEESRALNAKLLRAGKQVRYVELKGDDHWLSSASTRTLMLREMETFLAEHLGKKTAVQ